MIRALAREADLTLSAHTLRHTCLTRLVRGGADVVLVAELAGHRRRIDRRRWRACASSIDRSRWGEVVSGELRPAELRAEYICGHAVAFWALGAAGKALLLRLLVQDPQLPLDAP